MRLQLYPKQKDVEMPKLRAIEVVLSDGSVQTVHEPAFKDLGLFLHCLPALMSVAKSLSSMSSVNSDQLVTIPDINPDVLNSLTPLVASMSGLSEDEVSGLSLWDGVALMWAAVSFMPKNPPPQSTDLQASTSSISGPLG